MPVDTQAHFLGCYLNRPYDHEQPYTCMCGIPWGVPCKPEPAKWTPDIISELHAAEIAHGTAAMDEHDRFGWLAWRLWRDIGDQRGDRAWAGWLAAEMCDGKEPGNAQ